MQTLLRSRPWLAAAVVALVACSVAELAGWGGPPLIRRRLQAAVRHQVVWRQESPHFVHARFAKDTHPGDPVVYFRTWFFNITNLAAVQQGAKPALAEVGPFTYIKHRVKKDVWFGRDGRVRYRTYTYHIAQPELSNASVDAPITTLNIPLLGALEAISSLSPSVAASWLHILAGLIESWGDPRVSGLFMTRTARELLWGYEDPILARVAPFVAGVRPTFSLLHNMSSPAEFDDTYNSVVNTGLHNLSETWSQEVWANVSEITSWNPPHVERVRGSDAFQFPPGLALNASVEVWVGELFRAASLIAAEQLQLGPVPVLRLRPDPRQGEPDARYFQTIRGLMNVTAPMAAGPSGRAGKPGPPLFFSYPHFCGADERLAAGVEGVACDPAKHDLYLDVEPTTGIALRAAHRLMLSSWFGSKWKTIEPRVRDTFLPIFWVQESSEANPEQLLQFAPLLRAQGAIAALQRYARPAAVVLAVAAAACAAAHVVRHSSQEAPAGAGDASEPAGVDAEWGVGGTSANGVVQQQRPRRKERGVAETQQPAEPELEEPLLEEQQVPLSRGAAAAAGWAVAGVADGAAAAGGADRAEWGEPRQGGCSIS